MQTLFQNIPLEKRKPSHKHLGKVTTEHFQITNKPEVVPLPKALALALPEGTMRFLVLYLKNSSQHIE